MTVINIDSKRNISLKEIRREHPYVEHIVRLERNRFALMNDNEFLGWKKKNVH